MSGFTYPAVLEALRKKARQKPGDWVEGYSEQRDLRLAWVFVPGAGERLRISHRLIAPYSEDLLEAYEALPEDLRIERAETDPEIRTLTLHLVKGDKRGLPERCSRCGARKQYGTKIFGQPPLCAVCTTHPSAEPDIQPQPAGAEGHGGASAEGRGDRDVGSGRAGDADAELRGGGPGAGSGGAETSRIANGAETGLADGREEDHGGQVDRSDGERGSALIATLVLVVALGLIVGGTLMASTLGERERIARLGVSRAEVAATAALDIMSERVRAAAQLRLGNLSAADLAALDAALRDDDAGLPDELDAPIVLDETGYRLVRVRENVVLGEDAQLLDVWTEQPRVGYTSVPRPHGLVAGRVLDVEVFARARTPDGQQRTVSRTLAIGRFMPHQHALYHAGGTAELCASESPASSIGGSVRIDGAAYLADCAHPVRYAGAIEARDGVTAANPARHTLVTRDEAMELGSWDRASVAANPQPMLLATRGTVRIPAAWGGTFEETRLQEGEVAGTGECADRVLACGGRGYFAPALTVRYDGATGLLVSCGPACPGGAPPFPAGTFGYKVWPFAGPVAPGVALPDPDDPDRLWRGLFPDGRRERRCDATLHGVSFRTHRCPTSAYGVTLDLALLPVVPGGVLHVRAAAVPSSGAAATGAPEVLLIHNADTVQGPLSIVSDLPVAIVGSLNSRRHSGWRGPPPLMIDAPRILLLPEDAREQVGFPVGEPGWSSVWDSVPPSGSTEPSALPITATRNVSIYAVLRTGACSSRGGGYFGGSWEGTPALLGDWSRVSLKVVGAVEAVDDAGATAAGCLAAGGIVPGSRGGIAPSGTPNPGPASRTLVHDPRLLHPDFRVPGSYLPANIPASGVPGNTEARTRDRQASASGGTIAVWVVRESAARGPRAAVALTPLPPLPVAPSPLP